jgi:L-lysine 6-oxidase
MKTQYKIHPAVGFARVGDAPEAFYLEPTTRGGLPTEFGPHGEEHPVQHFKEAGQVKRQAARFRVYREEPGKAPVALSLGHGLKSISWTVHVANKKSAWYQFFELQGDVMIGPDNTYSKQGIPLRNATVLGDEERRKQLIIDPGPRTVSPSHKTAQFDAASAGDYKYVSFPPADLIPYAVQTLGGLQMTDDGTLLVLGGHGNAGGPKDSTISSFAGADGWFDDISDGPVIANVVTDDGQHLRLQAWVVTGSPKFAPELNNIASLADTFIDVGVRHMGLCPEMYDGHEGAFKEGYTACLERDVLPVFQAMKEYRWAANVDAMVSFATPPFELRDLSEANRENREAWFSLLRKPQKRSHHGPDEFRRLSLTNQGGNEPELAPSHQRLFARNGFPLMPMNSGDNSISNTLPEKFMALTPTQYFLLHQWAAGQCVSVRDNPMAGQDWPWVNPVDHACASNVVGEPMAPGIEVTWSMRNPDLLMPGDPFRIKPYEADYTLRGLSPSRDETLEKSGCEPGDLTKRMAIPWQADFFDCSVQPVNFSTPRSNKTISNSERIPLAPTFFAYWWPAQSPFNVYDGAMNPQAQALDAGQMVGQNVLYHRGINSFSDSVAGWKYLGFVLNRTQGPLRSMLPFYVEEERNYEAFQFGLMGLNADGSVLITQTATTTTPTDINDTAQTTFPIQWLVGN